MNLKKLLFLCLLLSSPLHLFSASDLESQEAFQQKIEHDDEDVLLAEIKNTNKELTVNDAVVAYDANKLKICKYFLEQSKFKKTPEELTNQLQNNRSVHPGWVYLALESGVKPTSEQLAIVIKEGSIIDYKTRIAKLLIDYGAPHSIDYFVFLCRDGWYESSAACSEQLTHALTKLSAADQQKALEAGVKQVLSNRRFDEIEKAKFLFVVNHLDNKAQVITYITTLNCYNEDILLPWCFQAGAMPTAEVVKKTITDLTEAVRYDYERDSIFHESSFARRLNTRLELFRTHHVALPADATLEAIKQKVVQEKREKEASEKAKEIAKEKRLLDENKAALTDAFVNKIVTTFSDKNVAQKIEQIKQEIEYLQSRRTILSNPDVQRLNEERIALHLSFIEKIEQGKREKASRRAARLEEEKKENERREILGKEIDEKNKKMAMTLVPLGLVFWGGIIYAGYRLYKHYKEKQAEKEKSQQGPTHLISVPEFQNQPQDQQPQIIEVNGQHFILKDGKFYPLLAPQAAQSTPAATKTD
jgi:hypothetical protein